jgi:hypothetical protein
MENKARNYSLSIPYKISSKFRRIHMFPFMRKRSAENKKIREKNTKR